MLPQHSENKIKHKYHDPICPKFLTPLTTNPTRPSLLV